MYHNYNSNRSKESPNKSIISWQPTPESKINRKLVTSTHWQSYQVEAYTVILLLCPFILKSYVTLTLHASYVIHTTDILCQSQVMSKDINKQVLDVYFAMKMNGVFPITFLIHIKRIVQSQTQLWYIEVWVHVIITVKLQFNFHVWF